MFYAQSYKKGIRPHINTYMLKSPTTIESRSLQTSAYIHKIFGIPQVYVQEACELVLLLSCYEA